MSDKRVVKIISNNGIKKSEIFHSPISVWLSFWAIILLMVTPIPMIFVLLYEHFLESSFQIRILVMLICLLAVYTFIAIFNRSFAITKKEFLVINSHFPFGSLKRFKLDEISDVKISSDWKLKALIIFGFRSNYVQIRIKNQKKKFYCLFLDVDCFYEGLTEKCLDDLAKSLRRKHVVVNMEI